MAFKDTDRDLGQHVRFSPNTKGTGRRGVPTAIAELAKTETAKPVADPVALTTTGTSTRGLRELKNRTIKPKH